MSSQIKNLDRDSMLVLYLAGEMSAKDQAQVETMLATDEALRRQYDELVAAKGAMDSAIIGADVKLPLPAPALASARQVSSAIKQWHIDRTIHKASISVRGPRRYGWLYAGATVAASIIVTIFVLWSRVDDGKAPVAVVMPDGSPAKMDTPADSTTNPSDDAPAEPVAAASADIAPAFFPADESQSSVNSAEQDLVALNALTDSIRGQEDAVTP